LLTDGALHAGGYFRCEVGLKNIKHGGASSLKALDCERLSSHITILCWW